MTSSLQTFPSISCPRFLSHLLLLFLSSTLIYFISPALLFCSPCLHKDSNRSNIWPTCGLTAEAQLQRLSFEVLLYITYESVWIRFWMCILVSLFICVCMYAWPCHEVVLWKSASQWWRVYWLVDQAPGVSTWQEGDPSRPSYWHTELICSAWSIPANWNYHCTASHVSALFVWLLLALCVFVCVFMEVEGMICICVTGRAKPRACPFCACRRGCFFVEVLYVRSVSHGQ